jgi:hypothetical protein
MTHPYASTLYAKAFAPEYKAVHLKAADTHILLRPIVGTDYHDALGVYPLCPMAKDAELEKDFADLAAQGLVSLVLVADPFFAPPLIKMEQAFDRVTPFKEHFICNLRVENQYTTHHRYEVKRAYKHCETRLINLAEHLDEWYGLYHTLIEKRGITGIQAFPKQYFAALCDLKPIVIAAFCEGRMTSAHLWFQHENYVYSHLAASSEEGYKFSAAYAVYDHSILYFREQGVAIMDLGGGAGNEASAGLTFLKKGFSNDTIMCYLCAKVLNDDIYQKLRAGKTTNYFPAYRG